MNVRAGFGMNGHVIRARIHESFEKRVDRSDHQMHVERLVAVWAQRLDHVRSDREVRDVMPVHHVDMNPVRTRLVDRAHLFAQRGKIGGQNRRCDEGSGHDQRFFQRALIRQRPGPAADLVLALRALQEIGRAHV